MALEGEIKAGDRLLWKPGTTDFRRVTVQDVGPIIVHMIDEHRYELGRKIEDVIANCERADLDTGIKPL